MKRAPILALVASAALALAIGAVVPRAFADSPQNVSVVAISPLSVPAAYQPKHFLRTATTGAGGVTLVKPARAVALRYGTAAPRVGAFTGDARSSAAAVKHVAPSASKEKAAHGKKAHPSHAKTKTKKKHVHKAKTHAKKKSPHSKSKSKSHKPKDSFWKWLLGEIHKHHRKHH